MNIKVKRTHEISDEEIIEIYDLFYKVFRKKRDVCFFREEFSNNPKGYSYHALCYNENDKIVGHNVYIPFLYKKCNYEFYLALSTDAMVDPVYQGQGIYRKLLQSCEDAAIKDGCKMRIGFPNGNSFPIQIKAMKYIEIGKLSIYCLPIRLSVINTKLKILDCISIVLAYAMGYFSYLSAFSNKIYSYKYEKVRKQYDKYRYRWFNGDYKKVTLNDCEFVYKKAEYKGREALFLMDVYPLSKANFDKVCRYMLFHEIANAPMILYVGHIEFTPFSMLKVPEKLEPKKFHFVVKVFDNAFFGDDVFKISSWNVNLSNYDLL